jgi:hypothetical protein
MEYFLTKRLTDARKRIPSLNRRAFDFLLSCDRRELENLALKMVAFADIPAALRGLQSAKPVNQILQEKKQLRRMNAASRIVPRRGARRPSSGHWNELGGPE